MDADTRPIMTVENVSVSAILNDITKLSLQKGDVLVLGDKAAMWMSMLPPAALQDWINGVGTDVQVIVGDASKLSREDLIKLLENAT